MWKDYSVSYLQRNRASGISIMAGAFIASLFLSLLCSLYYNFWIYEVEKIRLEEGSWQARITGELSETALAELQDFANLEAAVINEALSEEQKTVVDLYFQRPGTIYQDMPLIAEKLKLGEEAVSYHETLLSRYLIHDPQDKTPPLLLSFYLILLLVMSVSLILIIHNSFAVSMDARLHQFGILSSVGATPGQLFNCLMQEAAALCILPVLLGGLAGIGLSFGAVQVINQAAKELAGRHEAVWRYHPLVFLITVLAAGLTVLLSAGLPACKLSRMTPLEAIRNMEKTADSRHRRLLLLPLLFGTEGELAGNALRARKKALRTATLSLTLSFLGFSGMLCFFTLTGISTRHTYFERYQDAWDVMVTLPDTEIESVKQGEAIRSLPGVRSSVVYQKAAALCVVPEEELGEVLLELGGPEAVAGSEVTRQEDSFLVRAPILIMDDESFTEYCRQIGVSPGTDGCIVLNRIWDSINSNFRYREYVPFVRERQPDMMLQRVDSPGKKTAVPVLAYTWETPVLREEYEQYALVQFFPLSLWKRIGGELENTQADTYIRILGEEGTDLAGLKELEKKVLEVLPGTAEPENRIQEKETDESMRKGSMLLWGSFCALLAVIGIANVFSNTLGFLRQRKREFAQYMSVGMTPEGMRKMFAAEALVMAGGPLVTALPLTGIAVAFLIRASCLNPAEFWEEAPLIPLLIFILAVFAFVGLAYYIGGKRILACDLAEALRQDAVR